MDKSFSFTKESIEQLPIPDKGRVEYRDSKIPELRLRISANGKRSFSVFKRIRGGAGRPTRVTLGSYPSLKPPRARVAAQKILGLLVEGVNPREKRKIDALISLSLQEAFELYIASKELKCNTLNDYCSLMRKQLLAFKNKKLIDIKSKEISQLHLNLSLKSKARADYAMRLLRAIINFVNDESYLISGKTLILQNPVKIISSRKQWNNVDRKQGHVRVQELSSFARALNEVRESETLTGQSVCDAMLFALLTGLRKTEIFNLKWTDINEVGAYFMIPETKSGNPLELPLTPILKTILDCRKECHCTIFVFSAVNKYGQIRTPRKIVQKVKLLSGTCCDFHDLRRTFATTAEHLDIGTYKLKRLMNHVTNRNDVTAGYTVLTAETLRDSAVTIQRVLMENLTRKS